MSSSIRSTSIYLLSKLDVRFVVWAKMLTSSSPKLPLDQGDEASFYSRVIGVFSSLAKVLCCNQRKVLENGFPTSRPEDLRYYWRTKDQISRKIFCNRRMTEPLLCSAKIRARICKACKNASRIWILDWIVLKLPILNLLYVWADSPVGSQFVGSASVCLIIAEKTQGNRKAKASLKSFVPFHNHCTLLVDNCVRNLGRFWMIPKPA